MTGTGLATFDHTVQETNLWLKHLMPELGHDDRELALKALRTVLHALRDSLPLAPAGRLGDQLPILLRGFYYETWRPTGMSASILNREAFLARIRSEFPAAFGLGLERVAKSVFEVMWELVEPGEVAKVVRLLPDDLGDLWPRVARED
jgi:uncharacterized protein (DUF2267 family)